MSESNTILFIIYFFYFFSLFAYTQMDGHNRKFIKNKVSTGEFIISSWIVEWESFSVNPFLTFYSFLLKSSWRLSIYISHLIDFLMQVFTGMSISILSFDDYILRYDSYSIFVIKYESCGILSFILWLWIWFSYSSENIFRFSGKQLRISRAFFQDI